VCIIEKSRRDDWQFTYFAGQFTIETSGLHPGPDLSKLDLKNASVQQLLFMERLPFPLSSRAEPRDLQFRGPLVEA
jgi:hypothetical protein